MSGTAEEQFGKLDCRALAPKEVHSAGTWGQLDRNGLNLPAQFCNKDLGGAILAPATKRNFGLMGDPIHIPLNARLERLLEVLIDNYGVKELLSALLAVCWGRAAKATEEGQDPRRWSELAVKLGAVIEN
jgi:hypothetical protein